MVVIHANIHKYMQTKRDNYNLVTSQLVLQQPSNPMQSCRHDNLKQETEGGVWCITVIHWSGRTMGLIEWMWATAGLKVMMVTGLEQHKLIGCSCFVMPMLQT